jgi:hypothetical protein
MKTFSLATELFPSVGVVSSATGSALPAKEQLHKPQEHFLPLQEQLAHAGIEAAPLATGTFFSA